MMCTVATMFGRYTKRPMLLLGRNINVRCLTFSRTEKSVSINNTVLKSINRNPLTTRCRMCSGESGNSKVDHPTSSTSSEDPNMFKPIYLFKHIIIARFLARLKLYQTGLTLFLVPYSVFLREYELTTVETSYAILTLAFFATISLYVISGFTQRIAGIISLSNDDKNIRISRLSFWGKRVDEVFKLEELIPFSDSEEDVKKDIYKIIKFYSNDRKFYLFTFGVKVADKEKFETLIGPLK